MSGEPEKAAAPKRRLQHDERRQLIIETTLNSLARNGAEGTTLRSVCRELEVAPSLVGHFFQNWHDLLIAAYQTLVDRFMGNFSAVIEAPYPSARARMDAVIQVYLLTDWAGESSIGASIALWQLSRSVIELREPFTRYLEDRRRSLEPVLRELAVEAKVDVDISQLTDCFMLMLDGIWLEISLNPGSITEARTREMCWFWLDAVFGRPPGEDLRASDEPPGNRRAAV